MDFEIVGTIGRTETIAIGGSIDQLKLLVKRYGPGRWRKCKGVALVRLESGTLRWAEIHWYECHGKGSKEIKIKRFLGEGQ